MGELPGDERNSVAAPTRKSSFRPHPHTLGGAAGADSRLTILAQADGLGELTQGRRTGLPSHSSSRSSQMEARLTESMDARASQEDSIGGDGERKSQGDTGRATAESRASAGPLPVSYTHLRAHETDS